MSALDFSARLYPLRLGHDDEIIAPRQEFFHWEFVAEDHHRVVGADFKDDY